LMSELSTTYSYYLDRRGACLLILFHKLVDNWFGIEPKLLH